MGGKIIGAAWVRIIAGDIKGYGNVDDETPEFSISLFKEYRNRGIGTALINKMINQLREKGFSQASLSLQKPGFEVIGDENDEYLMIVNLR